MQKHDREYCRFVSSPLYHPRKEVGGGDVWYLSLIAFIYSILRSRSDSLRSHVVRNERLAFYSAFLNIHRVSVLKRCLVVAWLVPRKTAAISASFVYTIQPSTMSRHSLQSHIRRVHACLTVTCHLHFWQNDGGGTDTEIRVSTES